MNEPLTPTGLLTLAVQGEAFRPIILAIEAEAREGYVPEDDCAHSQKVACEKARAAALDEARAAVEAIVDIFNPCPDAVAAIDALREDADKK